MAWDWSTFWFVIIIGVLVLAFILALVWFVNLKKKRAQGPSHIELYFGENFRKIMDEWDFSTRDNVKDFKKNMNSRLVKVGGDIDVLETRKKNLDKRMIAVDKKMTKLEGM